MGINKLNTMNNLKKVKELVFIEGIRMIAIVTDDNIFIQLHNGIFILESEIDNVLTSEMNKKRFREAFKILKQNIKK